MLIIDATCAPADIAFPTDLELCDKARSWTERVLDRLWEQHGAVAGGKRKPRTYRETARRRFLNINKRRRKPLGKIRRELRYQLNCIHRNLCNIDKSSEQGLTAPAPPARWFQTIVCNLIRCLFGWF